MAFGDFAEVVTGSRGWDSPPITVTYASATPAANDLNVASVAGSTVVAVSTSGFTEDIETIGGGIELSTWGQVASGSSDNTCSVDDSGIDDPLTIAMSLMRGPVAATPADISDETGVDWSDPVKLAPNATTAQADEILIGAFHAYGSQATGNWVRKGTATPTSNMTQRAYIGSSSINLHQATQVLTATGTVGIWRDNPNADDSMLNYVTYKKAAGETITMDKWNINRENPFIPEMDAIPYM